MKTEWDYTGQAEAFLRRPDYAPSAIGEMLAAASIDEKSGICDIGAGVGHLTLALAPTGSEIVAVEPNDSMRALGIQRCQDLSNVTWFEGKAEATGQDSDCFDLVTFGSSFNVTERQAALRETSRILKSQGWFACMWNHRDLQDPLQAEIESIIKSHVPEYGYGVRREDQTDVIVQSELFAGIDRIDGSVVHEQAIDACVEAWRSHCTLFRQAGARFEAVIAAIQKFLDGLGAAQISVPYTTRIWIAQRGA